MAIGLLSWLTGLMFESVGDYQLARFKANPFNHGQVMRSGLWRYTRHPNYFGDFLVWWGFYGVAAEPGSWWWTICGPLLMSFLLIRVSGVPLLEKGLIRRLAGYDDYMRETSAFFPLPPK
jgi:steroid 5-alpha reductase family enzyme